MNDPKLQVIEKLKAASNVLVTVNASPTVDQLAACIGLTLLLNKLDKHATAVFSGEVPSTIEFLKPEDTLEKTTDSLRDFIISLDKAKADKLRYKVEDTVVKIFITPYRSKIGEEDLIFSQGDFNVDVVMALGVHRQQDLDEAIVAHGRILHDAVVIGINNTPNTELGSINWMDQSASSLSEMIASLPGELGEDILDGQIATALLTGVVAETNHFGNGKTTPHTMSISAELLSAGANQQLVAKELDAILKPKQTSPKPLQIVPAPTSSDGKMDIPHIEEKQPEPPQVQPVLPPPAPTAPVRKPDLVRDVKAYGPEVDEHYPDKRPEHPRGQHDMITEPPSYAAPPAAVKGAELYDPSIDVSDQPKPPLPLLRRTDDEPKDPFAARMPEPAGTPLDNARQPIAPAPAPAAPPQPQAVTIPQPQPFQFQPAPPTPTPMIDTKQTLSDIEAAVHAEEQKPPTNNVDPADGVDSARQAVENALQESAGDTLVEPLAARGAQPVNLDFGHQPPAMPPNELPVPAIQVPPPVQPQVFNPAVNEPAPLEMSPADQPFTMPLPPTSSLTAPEPAVVQPSYATAPQGPPPPPVPPPMHQ